MYTATHHLPVSRSQVCRWFGRACGVALFAVWAVFVAIEATQPTGFVTWPRGLYFQAAALAVVFAGYAVGWKHELAGALMIAVGALAFVVVTVADTRMLPGLATAWFLAPGVLYLLARHYERIEHGPATTA
jgi:hypothetical protein